VGRSIRVAAYGLTIVVIWGPLTLSLIIPTIGPFVLAIGLLGQLLWGGNLLTVAAHEHHGLDGGRAYFAGWLAPVLALLVAGSVVGVGLFVEEATEPSRAPDVYYPEPGRPGY